MYESKTPAQIYTLIVALLLASIGLAGLIWEASASTHVAELDASLLEPWHSGLYLLTGLLGLATWRRAGSARIYALLLGSLYALLALWSLLSWALTIETGLVPLQAQLTGGVLGAVIGLTGLAIGLVSPRHGGYRIPGAADAI